MAFPGDVAIYDAEMDSVSQVIQDDMNGLLGVDMWDPTDFLQDFHQISLTGALRAFTCSPRVDDDGLATDMRDSLVAGQLANGSWGISFGGTFFPDDTQTTSYAVMALIEYADKFGPDDVAVAAARAGNLFILSVTDGAGIVTAGSEFSESSGEAITALLAGSLKLGIESANILSDCVVAGSNLFSVDVTILDVTPDPTDVQAMSIEFAFDDSELDLLSITVPGGSIWGASFVDFTATGAGTGQIDVSSLLFGGISAGIGGVVCTLNFERKIGAVGVLDYSIVSAEIRDPDNSPIAACLTEAEGSARFILGDFTTTLVGSSTDCGPPGFGLPDGDVDVFDLGVFSSHFGAIDPAAEYCCIIDIGPTTTNFIFGEPTIDGAIDFEDLVIFSISFGFSTIGGYLAPAPGDLTDQVTNVRLVPMSAGSELLVDVVLNPAVAVQAMHAILDYDPSQLRFLGAERSGMTTGENNFLAVIPGDGIDLNLAALGVGNAWDEQGTVATLRFERLSEATSSIGFTKLDLRDSYNRQLPSAGEKLDLDGSVPAITAQTVNFLSPIQPNPIAIGSGGAVIRFGSRVAQNVELSIYSADGRVIRSLVSGSVGAGEHTVTWNGRDASGSRVSSGIYFARYQTPDYQTTIKFTVIR